MTLEVREEPAMALAEYARVPISFQVRRVLDVTPVDGGFGGFALSERAVDVPYVKDYDADDGGPARWPERFDLSNWGLLVARLGGRGVGAALFRAAEAWAAARGCRQLKVETQDVNLAACRFYARQGCVLGAIHRFAYPGLPHEVQLLWYRDLRIPRVRA